MKTKKLPLLLSAVPIILMCCSAPETKVPVIKAEPTSREVTIKEAVEIEEPSADQKTEEWFVAFDRYQSLGYGMQEADSMALIDINKKYNINKGDASTLAINHEEEEEVD